MSLHSLVFAEYFTHSFTSAISVILTLVIYIALLSKISCEFNDSRVPLEFSVSQLSSGLVQHSIAHSRAHKECLSFFFTKIWHSHIVPSVLPFKE
jgi:hypothetical protein